MARRDEGGSVAPAMAACRRGRHPSRRRPSPTRRSSTRCRRALPRSLDLFERHGEVIIRAQLWSQVHLVAFEPGRIEFRPVEDAPRDLANRLSQRLMRMDRRALGGRACRRPQGDADPGSSRRRGDSERRTRWRATRWCVRCSTPFPARRSRRCASALSAPTATPSRRRAMPAAMSQDDGAGDSEEDET